MPDLISVMSPTLDSHTETMLSFGRLRGFHGCRRNQELSKTRSVDQAMVIEEIEMNWVFYSGPEAFRFQNNPPRPPEQPDIAPPEMPPGNTPSNPPRKEPPPEVEPNDQPVELPPTDPAPPPARLPPQAGASGAA